MVMMGRYGNEKCIQNFGEVFTAEKNIRYDTAGVLLFSFLHIALTIKQILQACSCVCVCVCVYYYKN